MSRPLALKACPHCRRKERLSPLSRRFVRQSHFSATVWTGLNNFTQQPHWDFWSKSGVHTEATSSGTIQSACSTSDDRCYIWFEHTNYSFTVNIHVTCQVTRNDLNKIMLDSFVNQYIVK